MCAPPAGGVDITGLNLTTEAVIDGSVVKAGVGVAGAYVRLLDHAGEFTAEVVTSATGGFRFFAGPGKWTLSVLSSAGAGRTQVTAVVGTVTSVEIDLS